jgi:hypothetical protein
MGRLSELGIGVATLVIASAAVLIAAFASGGLPAFSEPAIALPIEAAGIVLLLRRADSFAWTRFFGWLLATLVFLFPILILAWQLGSREDRTALSRARQETQS